MARWGGRARPRTLTGRLLLWHAVAVLGMLLALGVVADRVLERNLVGQLTDSLIAEARAVRVGLASDPDLQPTPALQSEARRLGLAIGARVTIIRTDGLVLADSEHDPRTMANHRTRPEVVQALAGRVGQSSRVSATIGIAFRYVALPPRQGRIVRVALPLTTVQSRLRTIRTVLGIGFGLAGLAGLLVLSVIAGSLSRPLRRITASVERVGRGDLAEEVPEEGTEELLTLGQTVNRMRREVSARVETAEEDRATREAILSALEEGVVLLDEAGSVVYANDRARDLLGASFEHARNLAAPGLREAVAAAARGQAAGPSEVVMGSDSRIISATAGPVPGHGTVLLVLRDVTRPKMLDSVRRDFVANASHELKTPVASIQALAETIGSAAGDDPDSVPRFAEQLERESVRLARIISDLLDLSRLEGEAGPRSRLVLDEVAREETGRYQDRAREQALTLSLRTDGPASVDGSQRDLGLVVRNLVENAIQYTRPGGSVEVRVFREDGWAVLEVRDSGIGIPARDRARIFERFYRVDRARSRATGGTGLGLAIVKHVAENHGGTVLVQSELGRGSTFTVRLPLAGPD